MGWAQAVTSRALQDTRHTARGWGFGIQVLLVFVLGTGIHYHRHGLNAVLEEWDVWLSYTLAPVGLLAVLIFLWNLFRAPIRLRDDRVGELLRSNEELQNRLNALEGSAPTRSDTDEYTLGKIRWLCATCLDPASEALQQIKTERLLQLEATHPDVARVLDNYSTLIHGLTGLPSIRLHERLSIPAEVSAYMSPQDVSDVPKLLREYVMGYIHVIKLLMDLYPDNRRELLHQPNYEEWRVRHVELRKKIDELAGDSKLKGIYKEFRCMNWPIVKN